MPFYKYAIEPVRLGRQPLPPDKGIGDELEAVANNTLVQVLKQLSHLVTIADTVFLGVSVECRKVHERTVQLKARIEECETKANKLDAKRVQVPVGDINTFHSNRIHFKSDYEFDTSKLFVPSSRPSCVQEHYDRSSVVSCSHQAPSKPSYASCPLQRFLEHYCWSESSVEEDQKPYRYVVCRPVIGDKKWRDHLDIETRKPACVKLALERKVNGLAQASSSQLNTSSSSAYLSKEDSFDATENGFSGDETICLPSPEERTFEMSMEFPSILIPVDVSGKGFQRMTTLRRSLIHGDFFIKRKKRKSRKIAAGESSTSKAQNGNESKSIQTDFDGIEGSTSIPSTSKGSLGEVPKRRSFSNVRYRGNRHSERSSLYASVDIIGPKPDKKHRFSMDPKVLSSVTNKNSNNELATKTSETKKTRRRSLLPISTLSAAMTVAVKLRGGINNAVKKGKGRKDENGQSSSGNWSATSSVRGSGIDSDVQKAGNTSEKCYSSSNTSRSSLEKDSVLSDTTTASKQDQRCNGYASDVSAAAASNPSTRKSKQDWLRETNEDSSSSFNNFSPPLPRSQRYQTNPYAPGSLTNDDESESVYSVDTDGYFTSMHTDSGLKNLTPKKTAGTSDSNYGKVCRRESISSVSTIGNISVNSILSRSAFETCSNHSSSTFRAAPPTPPPRVTSAEKKIYSNCMMVQNSVNQIDDYDLPEPPPSPPLSDPGVQERLQQKTQIKTCNYPLMCTVSPETSDEERKAGVVLSNQQEPTHGLNMYGEVLPITKPYTATFPETPPYTPCEERVLSSFSPPSCHTSPIRRVLEVRSSAVSPVQLVDQAHPKHATSKAENPPNVPLIPLKYAQHITVTPVTRNSRMETSRSDGNGVIRARISPFLIRGQSSPGNLLESKLPIVRPTTPKADGHKTNEKPSAKVTLDCDGQVVFSSNSLGRRRDGHPMNYLTLSPSRISERKYNTLPTRLTNYPGSRASSPLMSPSRRGYSSLPRSNVSSASIFGKNKKLPYSVSQDGSTSTDLTNRADFQSNHHETSQFMSPDSLNRKKPMSNEDLFLAIHSCKKRLNIKTDLDVRPETPVNIVASNTFPKPARNMQNRNELAESGCLSPRSPAFPPSDPRSGENIRQTRVADRHGTSRQTSLRDFKMLLSQTGTGSPNQRKSASELLQSSPLIFNRNRTTQSMRCSPSKDYNHSTSMSPRLKSSSTDEFEGSQTVPFKRGSRGRLSLQAHYENYNCPPILEDTSEETANPDVRNASHFRPISRQPQTISGVNVPQTVGTHFGNRNRQSPFRGYLQSSPVSQPSSLPATSPIKPATSTWV